MSREVTKTVFKFEELSDSAKEKAREWYRGGSAGDEFYAESALEDAKDALKILGYRVDNIYYSGFSSQGDGAQFVGAFYASDYDAKGTNGVQKLLIDRPTDTGLARCAAEIERILLLAPELSASISRFGNYSHEMCTRIDVETETENLEQSELLKEAFKEVSRDLMRWIYKALEAEYEWANADAQVDENIIINEYEFNTDGSRYT